MKNKFIFSALFLICIFFLPSFCYALTVNDSKNEVSFDCLFPEDVSDYVVFRHKDTAEYYIFGFKDKETALKTYIKPFSSNPGYYYIIPRNLVYCYNKYNYPISNGGGGCYAGNTPDKWLTAQNAYLGEAFVIATGGNDFNVIYSTFDVKDDNGNIIVDKTKDKPFIVNKEQIQTGKFDKVVVNAADYTNQELYLLTYWFTENTDNPFDTMLPRKIIPLKLLNNYYSGTKNEKAIYEVPFGHTGIDLVER